ncbi:hypothetical protein FB451DRAFT_1390209 [Mycena latifolia]|nr:hypothetical protein FB451DRAFT_1390209 [Mycena latifolia]
MPRPPKNSPGKRAACKRKLTAKAALVKTTGKNKKKKIEVESSEDSEADELEELPAGPAVILEVDWKPPALSQTLITLIMEDKAIKQSLYPPCGPNASTTEGGGQPKVHAHWKLFRLLLGNVPKYATALLTVKTPKERLAYANKIKNRLSTMARITREYNAEMGETGAGIDNADQIDMTVKNPFTTKWAKISATCPWYFDMRNLIAQRPNLVPTGLGHSSTGADAGVILPEPTTEEAEAEDEVVQTEEMEEQDDTSGSPFPWETTPGRTPDYESHKRTFSDVDVDVVGSGDDYEPSSPVLSEPLPLDDVPAPNGKKIKAKKQEQARKTPAKVAASDPAPTPSAAPKPAKKSKVAEFSEIVKTEELTRQKEIELASLRMQEAMQATAVKGRIVEKREDRRREERRAKQEERMMKLKLRELKMRQAHELRMAGASTSHAANFPFDTHTSSRSHDSQYATSEPSDYLDFDGFNGNAAAGPSTSTTDMNFADDAMSFGAFASSLGSSLGNQ